MPVNLSGNLPRFIGDLAKIELTSSIRKMATGDQLYLLECHCAISMHIHQYPMILWIIVISKIHLILMLKIYRKILFLNNSIFRCKTVVTPLLILMKLQWMLISFYNEPIEWDTDSTLIWNGYGMNLSENGSWYTGTVVLVHLDNCWYKKTIGLVKLFMYHHVWKKQNETKILPRSGKRPKIFAVSGYIW